MSRLLISRSSFGNGTCSIRFSLKVRMLFLSGSVLSFLLVIIHIDGTNGFLMNSGGSTPYGGGTPHGGGGPALYRRDSHRRNPINDVNGGGDVSTQRRGNEKASSVVSTSDGILLAGESRTGDPSIPRCDADFLRTRSATGGLQASATLDLRSVADGRYSSRGQHSVGQHSTGPVGGDNVTRLAGSSAGHDRRPRHRERNRVPDPGPDFDINALMRASQGVGTRRATRVEEYHGADRETEQEPESEDSLMSRTTTRCSIEDSHGGRAPSRASAGNQPRGGVEGFTGMGRDHEDAFIERGRLHPGAERMIYAYDNSLQRPDRRHGVQETMIDDDIFEFFRQRTDPKGYPIDFHVPAEPDVVVGVDVQNIRNSVPVGTQDDDFTDVLHDDYMNTLCRNGRGPYDDDIARLEEQRRYGPNSIFNTIGLPVDKMVPDGDALHELLNADTFHGMNIEGRDPRWLGLDAESITASGTVVHGMHGLPSDHLQGDFYRKLESSRAAGLPRIVDGSGNIIDISSGGPEPSSVDTRPLPCWVSNDPVDSDHPLSLLNLNNGQLSDHELDNIYHGLLASNNGQASAASGHDRLERNQPGSSDEYDRTVDQRTGDRRPGDDQTERERPALRGQRSTTPVSLLDGTPERSDERRRGMVSRQSRGGREDADSPSQRGEESASPRSSLASDLSSYNISFRPQEIPPSTSSLSEKSPQCEESRRVPQRFSANLAWTRDSPGDDRRSHTGIIRAMRQRILQACRSQTSC